jgi:glycerol-3-phosphate dehydrogenase (NAD(P)+)
VLDRLLPLLRSGTVCVSVAKGLDRAGRPVARILEAALGEQFDFAVLHGPMIAEEIQAGRHAFAELAARGAGTMDRILDLFAGTRLHLRAAADMPGINWAVVLKNVYALAFGMADELGCGDNVRGWLVTTALAELDTIVQCMGGAAGTASGLAGLGDLVSTATSEHSHHHELGRRLARLGTGSCAGGPIEGEAIRTVAALEEAGLLDEARFPLYRFIHGVIRQPAGLHERLEALLAGA